MTRTAAIRQAREESHMYSQGGGYILSTWDESMGLWRLSKERPYGVTRRDLSDWRVGRALILMGDEDGPLTAYVRGGQGSIEERVADLVAHPYTA